MKTLQDAANKLRAAAEDLERLQGKLLLPADEALTLSQAIDKLRAALAPDHVTLDMSIRAYSFEDTPTVTYKVWDGGKKELYEAPTLSGAVNAALLARTQPPAEPLAQAEALIEAQVRKQEDDSAPY